MQNYENVLVKGDYVTRSTKYRRKSSALWNQTTSFFNKKNRFYIH